MTVTVVTGVYGGYDILKNPPPQSVDVEWVCVTDDPNLISDTWKIVYQPRSLEVHPRLAAKLPKCLPWTFADADPGVPVIWMDASFSIKYVTSIERLVEVARQDRGSVWQFVHPNRNCIYSEALFSRGLPKYITQPIVEQAAHYADRGHPNDWGLWATGLIVYPRWTLWCRIGEQWLLEQLTWTNQDQVSQPYVWHLFDRRPRELPGHLLDNEYVMLHPHLDGT